MDWQDLHSSSALAWCGPLSAATGELGVDHATVGRRTAALESSLGLRLTERLSRCTTPTGHRWIIVSGADEMYRIADRIRIQVGSLCAEPAVPINVSVLPTVAARLIALVIAGLTRKHPGIMLSLSGVSHHALLNKSEVGIVVRLERPDDSDLMTRRIGTMRFGPCAPRFWQEVSQEDWVSITYNSTLAHAMQQQWLEPLLNERRVILRANDPMAQQQATRKGLGVTALPYFIGDSDSELTRLPENLSSSVRNI